MTLVIPIKAPQASRYSSDHDIYGISEITGHEHMESGY